MKLLVQILLGVVWAGGCLWLLVFALAEMKRRRESRVSQEWLTAARIAEGAQGFEEGAPRRGREPAAGEPKPSATDAYARPREYRQ